MNIQDEFSRKKSGPAVLRNILIVTALLLFGIIVLAFVPLVLQFTGVSPVQAFSSFLGLDSVHIWWYISRASGLMAYLLVWLSTLWGFAISSKIFDSFLKREVPYDFHEHLSLLSLGFVLVHMVVLLLDRVEPLSLIEVLVPFVSSYRLNPKSLPVFSGRLFSWTVIFGLF